MFFHTWAFVAFFAVFYPVWLAVSRTRLASLWLLAASYFFYGWVDPFYLILITYSIVVDYIVVAIMDRRGRRRGYLAISIVNNLALLGFFKYGAFAAANINAVLDRVGASFEIAEPGMLLPVGLSFYIFQSLSYLIDYYRGDIARERNILRHAVYVSLFPRLLAGPIERARNLLPQLRRKVTITKADFTDGLSLFVVGLFKKIALADYLAMYVDKVYGAPDQHQGPALLLATFLFTWQIYFDFSGYTDMARGIARMMGFRLMLNFNNPYLATSLGDFWGRWHISLSSWFKDYVYIPLGGNRSSQARTYTNMFVTMVISGLWHGAAWTFVLWGVVHALGRFVTRELERTPFYRERIPKVAKQLLVFTFVMFAWAFFRAESISDAWVVVSGVFSAGWADPQCPALALLLVAAVWVYQYMYESPMRRLLENSTVRIAMVVAMILYMAILVSPSEQPFIYLKF